MLLSLGSSSFLRVHSTPSSSFLRVQSPPPFLRRAGFRAGLSYATAADLSATDHVRQIPAHVSPFWQGKLRELTKPAAIKLVPTLSKTLKGREPNALCFQIEDMEKSLVAFAKKEKDKRPDHLLLIRCGEFYETYGVDAVMLVEHAGLNPMGGKCRAGCPISNLQQTLDSLTSNGLTVAVYEEMAPAVGPGLKYQRGLSQVVSPASPTYMYEACLSPHQIAYRGEPPPIAAVTPSASGFSVVFVQVDARTWRVHQRLSEPALRALLTARPHAPPLLINGHDGPGGDERYKAKSARLPFAAIAKIAPERKSLHANTPAGFPLAVLQHIAHENDISIDDFQQLPTRGGGDDKRSAPPTPIYLSTATQIGLLPTAGIPDLPRALLPDDAPAVCAAFLRRWLLLPPRADVADAARTACVELATLRTPLPAAQPVPVGKLVGLLLAKQANAATFLELRKLLASMHLALNTRELRTLNHALLRVVEEEAGLSVEHDHLLATACDASARIGDLVANEADTMSDKSTKDPNALIPASFFDRNEPFRGMVKPAVLTDEYTALEDAAAELCDAVAADVALGPWADGAKALIYDINNNALHMRAPSKTKAVKAEEAAAESIAFSSPRKQKVADLRALLNIHGVDTVGKDKKELVELVTSLELDASNGVPVVLEPARDRNNRLMPNRLVTARVREATGAYHAACADLERAVKRGLKELCEELHPQLPTVVTAAHYALLSTTLSGHVACTLSKGWAVPELKPIDEPANKAAGAGAISGAIFGATPGAASSVSSEHGERTLEIEGMWPYWLPVAHATRNDVRFEGLWLLTAPNMAGKSSLMRGMLTSALLANSGLLAPVGSARVPRYDACFSRRPSFDTSLGLTRGTPLCDTWQVRCILLTHVLL